MAIERADADGTIDEARQIRASFEYVDREAMASAWWGSFSTIKQAVNFRFDMRKRFGIRESGQGVEESGKSRGSAGAC